MQYLEVRFGSRTLRRIGSTLYILVTVIYLSLAMYAPAVALAAVIKIMSLESFIVLAGILCTFYVGVVKRHCNKRYDLNNMQGGIKAVIWTDALQAFVMFAGLIVVVIKVSSCFLERTVIFVFVQGTYEAGGVAEVWRINRENGRLELWRCFQVLFVDYVLFCSWDVDPFHRMTALGIIIGQCVSWLGWYGINQSAVQRFDIKSVE